MSEEICRTYHGNNIAAQIQGEDAYGDRGQLNAADVWNILDNIHTSLMDDDPELADLVQIFYHQVAAKYPNAETI